MDESDCLELNHRYDQLGLALLQMSDLDDFAAVLKCHDRFLFGLTPDDKDVASVFARVAAFHALGDVAEEVLRLKREAQNGNEA